MKFIPIIILLFVNILTFFYISDKVIKLLNIFLSKILKINFSEERDGHEKFVQECGRKPEAVRGIVVDGKVILTRI
jgi:hypothetical protein